MKKLSLILAVCMLMLSLFSCMNKEVDFELQIMTNESIELTKIYSTKHYDVYLYGLDMVALLEDGEEMPLSDALEKGLIDMETILSDAEDAVEPFYFFDGGSQQYVLDDYNIFVSHAEWDGDDFPDAVYFFPKGITIDEVKSGESPLPIARLS